MLEARQTIVLIQGVCIFFSLPLMHFSFAFLLYLTFLLHLLCPGLCVNSLGECGNMARHSVTFQALNLCPAQQMARADFMFTEGQFPDISHFPTIISVTTFWFKLLICFLRFYQMCYYIYKSGHYATLRGEKCIFRCFVITGKRERLKATLCKSFRSRLRAFLTREQWLFVCCSS